MAKWCRPAVVISSEKFGAPTEKTQVEYTKAGAHYLATGRHGAVTVLSGPEGLFVATFRTGLKWQVK